MKKLLLTLVGVICSLGMWADTTSWKPTKNSTSPVTIGELTATFKNNTSKGSTAGAGTWTFTDGKVTSDQNGLEIDFYSTVAGTVDVILGANLANNKGICLSEGTNQLTTTVDDVTIAYNGTVSAGIAAGGKISFEIEAGKTYTFYCAGTKWACGGIDFTPEETNDKIKSDLAVTSETLISLPAHGTSQITYTSSGSGNVTFTSSDVNVATVDGTGLITWVGVGTAKITVAQAADDTYNAGSVVVTVNAAFARITTSTVGEFVVSPANGTLANTTWISKDGSLYVEGKFGAGSNTYSDMKNDHMKMAYDIVFTLPTNYPVNTVDVFGYGNGSSEVTVTLKSIDGNNVDGVSGMLCNKSQIPATDAASLAFPTEATESFVMNISGEARCYVVLNRNNQTVTLNDGGDGNHYASYYFAAEQKCEGADVYTATLDGTTLNLTKCEDGIIPARTGVVLVNEEGGTSATLTPSYTGATKGQGDLIGASGQAVKMNSYYASGANAAGKVFTFGKEDGVVGFYKYTGTEVAAKKAYLYSETLGASAGARLRFPSTSGITNVNANNAERVAYNLAGQRVNNTVKGIVVVDGKKYVNK